MLDNNSSSSRSLALHIVEHNSLLPAYHEKLHRPSTDDDRMSIPTGSWEDEVPDNQLAEGFPKYLKDRCPGGGTYE